MDVHNLGPNSDSGHAIPDIGDKPKYSLDHVVEVRTGLGTVRDDGSFTDVVKTVWRTAQPQVGWESVRYRNKRYQLHGGIRTPRFICLNSPIVGRKPALT